MSWLINITDYSNATADNSLMCEDQQESVILWTCATVVFILFGVPGVVAVLLDMFQKGRKGTLFTPNDVFMSNLTVMDGLYLLFLLPELYNLPHGHNFAYTVFISFLFSFNLCGRPLFITCISLDCYLAVVHPVTYRARKSLTPRVLMAVGVWTVTVIFGLYFASRYDEVFMDLSLVFFFASTLPIIGFCDFSILWTLKRSNSGGKDVHPQKKKALQIITINLVITFTSYLPPIITVLVCQFLSLDNSDILCLVVISVMNVTLVGNAVSLILYVNNLGKLDRLKCWKQK